MYLLSFLIFAIAANVIALPLIKFASRRGKSCHPSEYIVIYLTWVLFVGLMGFIFHGIDRAMIELHVSPAFGAGFFAVAGILGGLSLLPKILLAKKKLNDRIVTIVSSILIAVAFTKFSVLIFLFTADT